MPRTLLSHARLHAPVVIRTPGICPDAQSNNAYFGHHFTAMALYYARHARIAAQARDAERARSYHAHAALRAAAAGRAAGRESGALARA